jgi:hypothetical protein
MFQLVGSTSLSTWKSSMLFFHANNIMCFYFLSVIYKTGTLMRCWWECKLVQPLWKAVWRFLKKLKLELPYDPVIPFLSIYPNKCKWRYNRDTGTLMFITALFTIAKLWKQLRYSITDKWIKKFHFTMEFYLAIRNNVVLFEGKWMQLEDTILREISQAQKDKMFSLICGR